ncbi:MAG TPA: hypothetical protein VG734_03965 [Lacunisphaera sp.]|nr:hypothetical protein [Lacunisphaera sp.]
MTCYDHLTDPLLSLALRIARRADELAREATAGHEPWLRAEEEILGLRLPAPSLPSMSRTCATAEPVAVET